MEEITNLIGPFLEEHGALIRVAVLALVALAGLVIWRKSRGWIDGVGTRAAESRLQKALASGNLRRAAEIQLERGLFREAARIYERAGDHERMARALSQAGDLKTAAAAFERASLPAEAAALYRKSGELAKAAEAYSKSDDPRHQRAAAECLEGAGDPLRAARMFERLGDHERAADSYAKCDKVEPRDYVAVMLQNAAMAARDDVLRQRLWKRTAEESQKIGDHERAALAYDRAGDRVRAATLYEQALRRYDVAAAIHRELGDETSAARLTIAAGGEVPVLRQLELRARERGDAERARQLAQQIADLEPRSVSAPSGVTTGSMAPASSVATQMTPSAAAGPANDRFEILGELGRGGMGVVYKARDKRLDRLVALKFLPKDAEADETLVSVFRREARAAAALAHPSIVTVYDVGTIGDREYIAMELVDGQTLDRVLASNGPPPLADALTLLELSAEAIAAAHAKGIIHRDLKPANIMRTKSGIKVMDFGLAKAVGASRQTQKTVIAGTPAYAPPEQFTGATDQRSDVFALGATFYEILTGTLPGVGEIPASTATGYPTPRDRVPGIPARLSELVMRCLERDPARRPQDAGQVLAEIRAIREAIRAADDELRRFLSEEEPAPAAGRPAPAAPTTQAPAAVRPAPAAPTIGVPSRGEGAPAPTRPARPIVPRDD